MDNNNKVEKKWKTHPEQSDVGPHVVSMSSEVNRCVEVCGYIGPRHNTIEDGKEGNLIIHSGDVPLTWNFKDLMAA